MQANPKGTSPISTYIAIGAGVAADKGRTVETYAERTISATKTESVKIPSKTEKRLGRDFSNDRIAAAAMKEDAIAATVTKGDKTLR